YSIIFNTLQKDTANSEKEAVEYISDDGSDFKVIEIPAEYKEQAEKYREEMLEAISEVDDTLIEKYLSGEVLTEKEVVEALRKGTLEVKFIPMICGSAFKNKGVQQLLDSVNAYLPSPLDIPPVEGVDDFGNKATRKADDNEPFSALVFKVATDPFIGKLTYIRVYSGKLISGSYIQNSTKDSKERVSRIFRMHSNHREEVKEVEAGEIVGIVGLKAGTTGDTLCDEKSKIILESMDFPDPVIWLAIEPKTKADEEKLGVALGRLAEEDPTFKIKMDQETGQTVIAGMGELHLDIIVDRMQREFNIAANIGKPQVAYKEAITKSVNEEGKYIKQSGGRGQYGHVWLEIEPIPLEEAKDFEFVNKIVGGTIPKEYISSVEKGARESLDCGPLAGYPVVGVRVAVYDGSYHDVDSSDSAFKIATSMAMKSGMKKASPQILEPMMKVEVVSPEDYMGDIIGDLSSRRGRISGIEHKDTNQVVKADVPLSEMFGYATSVRSLSQGRASYVMEFSKYEPVPSNVAEKIIAKVTGSDK
ncbi:MAG: elongation factor G, partial [Spirochaetia bacterium]|nr:elongation factor G [Spirochaetia bacterium]